MNSATESLAIRRARSSDAENISPCLESAFADFRSFYTPRAFQDTVATPAMLRDRMRHMAVYVAVTRNAEVVGTIALGIQGEEGHLRGMAVCPACQGSGIAQRLLGAVESDLLAAGCMRVTLDTTAPLQRAIRFYKRNGFIHSGRVTDFFGMPLYEYVKQLNCARRRYPSSLLIEG